MLRSLENLRAAELVVKRTDILTVSKLDQYFCAQLYVTQAVETCCQTLTYGNGRPVRTVGARVVVEHQHRSIPCILRCRKQERRTSPDLHGADRGGCCLDFG
eukprot:4259832-Amphidinium_carterae.1